MEIDRNEPNSSRVGGADEIWISFDCFFFSEKNIISPSGAAGFLHFDNPQRHPFSGTAQILNPFSCGDETDSLAAASHNLRRTSEVVVSWWTSLAGEYDPQITATSAPAAGRPLFFSSNNFNFNGALRSPTKKKKHSRPSIFLRRMKKKKISY